MAELIKRDALKDFYCKSCPVGDKCMGEGCKIYEARRLIANIPSVIVIEDEPVQHGRWKWADGYVGTLAECGVCGLSPMGFYSLPKNQIGRLPEYEYCPRCGARMDGDEDASD